MILALKKKHASINEHPTCDAARGNGGAITYDSTGSYEKCIELNLATSSLIQMIY